MVKKQKPMACHPSGVCFCKALLAAAIIVLVWVSPETWSKIVITVAAALIFIGAGGCACHGSKKSKK